MQFTLDYSNLLSDILFKGYKYPDPNRENVFRYEVFPAVISVDVDNTFPLLASKKMWTRGIIVELLWMLSGRVDLNYLRDRGVKVWDKDAYNFAVKKGYKGTMEEFIDEVDAGLTFDMGHTYGHQWRTAFGRDQLLNVINKLLDPIQKYSSELIINSWNVGDLNIIDYRSDDKLYQAYLDEIKWNTTEDTNL